MATDTCLVLRPTEEEFSDFYTFILHLEELLEDSPVGLIKVIPPASWRVSLVHAGAYDRASLHELKVRAPIRQIADGKSGVYSVNLIELPEMTYPTFLEKALKIESNISAMGSSSSGFGGGVDGHSNDNSNSNIETNSEYSYAQAERTFWKTISNSSSSSNAPIYGADIPGSLFPPLTNTDSDCIASTSSWNLNKLNHMIQLLKNSSNATIPGVNSPMLYVGMFRAMFAFHCEDYDLYSINYLHVGAPKSWYSIPLDYKQRFETLAGSYFCDEKRECKEFLRHKTALISPSRLKQSAISFHTAVQHEGEFMITRPGSYHAGFNHGINIAESTNFSTPQWLFDHGFSAKRCLCRPYSVSLDTRLLETLLFRSFLRRAKRAKAGTKGLGSIACSNHNNNSKRNRNSNSNSDGDEDEEDYNSDINTTSSATATASITDAFAEVMDVDNDHNSRQHRRSSQMTISIKMKKDVSDIADTDTEASTATSSTDAESESLYIDNDPNLAFSSSSSSSTSLSTAPSSPPPLHYCWEDIIPVENSNSDRTFEFLTDVKDTASFLSYRRRACECPRASSLSSSSGSKGTGSKINSSPTLSSANLPPGDNSQSQYYDSDCDDLAADEYECIHCLKRCHIACAAPELVSGKLCYYCEELDEVSESSSSLYDAEDDRDEDLEEEQGQEEDGNNDNDNVNDDIDNDIGGGSGIVASKASLSSVKQLNSKNKNRAINAVNDVFLPMLNKGTSSYIIDGSNCNERNEEMGSGGNDNKSSPISGAAAVALQQAKRLFSPGALVDESKSKKVKPSSLSGGSSGSSEAKVGSPSPNIGTGCGGNKAPPSNSPNKAKLLSSLAKLKVGDKVYHRVDDNGVVDALSISNSNNNNNNSGSSNTRATSEITKLKGGEDGLSQSLVGEVAAIEDGYVRIHFKGLKKEMDVWLPLLDCITRLGYRFQNHRTLAFFD